MADLTVSSIIDALMSAADAAEARAAIGAGTSNFNPATPGAIGGTTPAAITGTTGTFSGALTAATFNGATFTMPKVTPADVTNSSGTAHADVTHKQAVLAGETWMVQMSGLFFPLTTDAKAFFDGPAADFVQDTGNVNNAAAVVPIAAGLAFPTVEFGTGSNVVGFLQFQVTIVAKFSAPGDFGLWWKSATNGNDVTLAAGSVSVFTKL